MCAMLLVDNSKSFEQVLRMLVTEAEMEVALQCVPDGKSALRYLEEGHKADIIFSDIDQPTSGGIDLLKRLTHTYPQLKRVVITESKCFEMAQYAVNLQLNGYLTKPIDQSQLRELLVLLAPETFYVRQTAEKVDRRERDEQAKRRLINEVLAVIERDVDRDIGLEYIAREVHISSCYLSALFREVTGEGLISYITNYRMNLAASLLLNTNLRVFEVAQRIGYRSTPYFCTVFKNKYGMTPSDFRDMNYGKSGGSTGA